MIYGESTTSAVEPSKLITEQERPHPPNLTRPLPNWHTIWPGAPGWWIAPNDNAGPTQQPHFGILRYPAPVHLGDHGIAALPAMASSANSAVEELGLRAHFRGLRWRMIHGIAQIIGPYIADAEKERRIT